MRGTVANGWRKWGAERNTKKKKEKEKEKKNKDFSNGHTSELPLGEAFGE